MAMDKVKFIKDVVIDGNLTLLGTSTAEYTEQVLTKGALTVINSDNYPLEVTLMGTVIRTGQTDENGNYIDYAILYDPMSEAIRLGIGTYDSGSNSFAFLDGEGKPVATRDLDVDDNGKLLVWDDELKSVISSGKTVEDIQDGNTKTILIQKEANDEIVIEETKDEDTDTITYTISTNMQNYYNKVEIDGLMTIVDDKLNVVVNGTGTTSNGGGAQAEGSETVASGWASHAEGFKTQATGNQSHAEGQQTIASGLNSHAEGGPCTEVDPADGVTKTFYTTASGPTSHAEGHGTRASGTQHGAHAEGSFTQATTFATHAEGYKTIASGWTAHSEGNGTEASGNMSHAEGMSTKATNEESHAEGWSTTASGGRSHSEGGGTIAGGYCSHAEGNYSQALSSHAHAEGDNTLVAEGANASHAEGQNTVARGGAAAHAEGVGTIANGRATHAQGRYNIENLGVSEQSLSGKYAHIVGNGTSDTDRSNAHTLDWEGNAWYAGDVKSATITIGNTTITEAQLQALLALLG